MTTVPRLFSLPRFTKWLASKRADKRYDFWCNECLLGQYMSEHGLKYRSLGTEKIVLGNGRIRPYPHVFNKIAETRPWTFGAALGRAVSTAR